MDEHELVAATVIGKSHRKPSDIEDAYLRLIGAVMKNNNPFYYLCDCASKWADIAGIELHIVYELARKGTEFESIPFQVIPHDKWHKLSLKLRRQSVKKTFSLQN